MGHPKGGLVKRAHKRDATGNRSAYSSPYFRSFDNNRDVLLLTTVPFSVVTSYDAYCTEKISFIRKSL